MTQDKEFLGTEPVGRLLWKLAVPTVIAQLVNMLYNIVDRIYIGHIPGDGSLALTGVGVCLPIIMIISAFSAFVSSGGAPRASIAMGRGDYDQAQRILGGCFTLQVGISLVLTAVLLIWNRPLLLAFGASGNTIGYAVQYMQIYALGTLFVELTLGLNAFITAQGFAQVGMKTVLIGAVCNILLDPLFIFGLNMGSDWKFWACAIGFILNYAAYFAEIYRSGIQSIPRGQYEAAEVLGYTKAQTFMKIVLPQVIKRILPAMGNEVITLVKDTSLAFVLGIMEMFSAAKALAASEVSMVPYAIAALIYWVFCLLIEFILNRVEKRLDYYHD